VAGNQPLLDSPAAHPSGGPQIDLNALVEPWIGAIVVALAVAVLLFLLLAMLQARRIRRLGKRIDRITRGEDGRSLEAMLDAHMDKVLQVASEIDKLAAREASVEATGRRSFQRVGLVRFNPFEDTGGNQSFAIALLDGTGNGFVLTSLHARTGTRVYAKTLTAAKAEGALSDEESAAIRQALAPAASAPGERSGA